MITSELGFGHYMRYMDDMVVLVNNKRKLHELKNIIEEYLKNELGLTLKENWQIFRFDYPHKGHGRCIDFMGFRFYRDKVTLSMMPRRWCHIVDGSNHAIHTDVSRLGFIRMSR